MKNPHDTSTPCSCPNGHRREAYVSDKCQRRAGEGWAAHSKIPLNRMPADWSKGKSAGPMRNKAMAEYAEALIVWDGTSRGTKSMIDFARARGLKVFVKVMK